MTFSMIERLLEKSKKVSSAGSTPLPDLRNVEEVQKFFIDEVQKGEELLGQGNYDEGVEHLTNAVAVCGQPQQLLQILQQTLPQPVFAMLLERLPSVSQRLSANPAMKEKSKGDGDGDATITDVDDLE